MTDRTNAYPANIDGFREVLGEGSRLISIERRLPDWVFTKHGATLAYCQYSHVIEGSFRPVLSALGQAHGDEYITVVQLDPAPETYFDWYDCFPAMRLRAIDIDATYWHAMSFEPQGDITGAPINIANVVGVAGSSGRWAVWGERRWDLGILYSEIPHGAWLDAGVPFVSPEEAIRDFTQVGEKRSPADFSREIFARNYFERPYATSKSGIG
ncbi:hypothetical protein [Leifsonia soli]|uniref:Uncharacterized protein n=1 Tax=Leifsonia soli TaxID=582665 RepID=A0A852T596_9MICO|nr:hypothetical protein [Leifsonia soli]NYD75670.1 hypothetical protein [Leifsonia soli]